MFVPLIIFFIIVIMLRIGTSWFTPMSDDEYDENYISNQDIYDLSRVDLVNLQDLAGVYESVFDKDDSDFKIT